MSVGQAVVLGFVAWACVSVLAAAAVCALAAGAKRAADRARSTRL